MTRSAVSRYGLGNLGDEEVSATIRLPDDGQVYGATA